jgi:hypothetical protein
VEYHHCYLDMTQFRNLPRFFLFIIVESFGVGLVWYKLWGGLLVVDLPVRSPMVLVHRSGMLDVCRCLDVTPQRPLLLFGDGVFDPFEYSHEEHVRGQFVYLDADENAAFRTAQFFVLVHDLLETFPAEGVLTGEHFAGGVQAIETHRALEEVVQRSLIHSSRKTDNN